MHVVGQAVASASLSLVSSSLVHTLTDFDVRCGSSALVFVATIGGSEASFGCDELRNILRLFSCLGRALSLCAAKSASKLVRLETSTIEIKRRATAVSRCNCRFDKQVSLAFPTSFHSPASAVVSQIPSMSRHVLVPERTVGRSPRRVVKRKA